MPKTPTYHEGPRRLQDGRETRRLAGRLEQVTAWDALTDADREFIERCAMVVVATAAVEGRPECPYKGGLPGSSRVIDDRTLALPDHGGRVMCRSWGNLLVNPHVGLLFLDFEEPHRIRVNGTATIAGDDPLRADLRRGLRGAGGGRARVSELPALHPSHAPGRALVVRREARRDAARARSEALRGAPGCDARA